MGFIAEWIFGHVEPGKRGMWLAEVDRMDLFLEAELRWEVSGQKIACEVDRLMARIYAAEPGSSIMFFVGGDFENFVKSNLRHSRDYILRIKEREFDLIFQEMLTEFLRPITHNLVFANADALSGLLKCHGLPVKAAAARAGISETSFRKALRGEKVKRQVVEKMAASFDVAPEELMR